MKSEKATSKTLPFTIGGLPVDKLDQRQMRELKKIADQRGITVEEALDHALTLFAEKFFASLDPGDKIVKFPSGGRRGRPGV